VRQHVNNILKKLGVHSRERVKAPLRRGFLSCANRTTLRTTADGPCAISVIPTEAGMTEMRGPGVRPPPESATVRAGSESQVGSFPRGRFANRFYPFFTASTISCRPCLASEKSIMVLSVS
jgi:hypothetical protein